MKMNVCPRCLDPGFERFKNYSICHSCQLNSVEDSLFLKETAGERPSVQGDLIHHRYAADIRAPKRNLQALFVNHDYEIIRQALNILPQVERQVIYLRFWEDQSSADIADSLDLQLRTVETILSQSYQTLRNTCLKSKGFSRGSEAPIAA